jgi:uncharacterized protein (DUF983 family)
MNAPERSASFFADDAPRDLWPSILRGLRGRCPRCGTGKLFRAYLKVNDYCPQCDEALYHQRADDAPPYITMLITGHVVVGSLLFVDSRWPDLPVLFHGIVWPLMAIAMSLGLLPPVKGGLVGLQWALRLHGFGDPNMDEAPPHATKTAPASV